MTDRTQKDAFLSLAAKPFSRLWDVLSRRLRSPSDDRGQPAEGLTDLCLARVAGEAKRNAETALPEDLLCAFSTEPLTAGDARFIGREEQSKRLLAVLDTWRAGRGAMVALTGPQGCGVTSLLQQFAQHMAGDESFCYRTLKRRPYDISDTLGLLGEVAGREQSCDSVGELVEYVNSLSPRVFAVDNGHLLACRIMGANEAIRVFGAVMVATQHRHLWVLGCQEYAWRRLVYVYGADRYFSEHIELPLFSEVELGQCLAARLQSSGITLRSAPSSADEPIPPPLARQVATLCRLSNGKPDLAFFYFLSSLRRRDEDGQLELQAVVALDFSALKPLISEELFALAEVAAHGQLTIDEHCAVFRCSRDESWLLLERLYHQCLLDKDETGAAAVYRLVPLYSDVITRYLSNANYLY